LEPFEVSQGFFDQYRILDLANEKAAYSTRLLADLGAEVVKVEPPNGDKSRRYPPFFHNDVNSEKSLYFLFHNLNKRSVTLDIEQREGAAIFCDLIKTVDVVVESFQPGYLKQFGLDYESMKERNPRLVMASVTDFGQWGPHNGYKSSDLVNMGMSGYMQMTGEPGGSPARLGVDHSYFASSLYAAVGVAVALYHRHATGKGQHLDISTQEAAAAFITDLGQAPTWFCLQENQVRTGIRLAGAFPGGFYPVRDGWVAVTVFSAEEWQAFAQWVSEVTGNKELLDPMYKGSGYARASYVDFLTEIVLQDFFPKFGKEEFFHEAQRRGIPAFPSHDIGEIVGDQHLNARNFFVNVDHPLMGTIKFPRMPFNCSQMSWQYCRSAPLLGQHNEDIYCGELGYSRQDLAVLKQAGVI